MKVLIINGPNLDMLAKRDGGVYGETSYEELCNTIRERCSKLRIDHECFQSNYEGELIERIHKLDFDALIINPGALSHYSYSLRDALEIYKGPKVEVHISNIYAREKFRHTSVVSPVCNGTISGLGLAGYLLALNYLVSGG